MIIVWRWAKSGKTLASVLIRADAPQEIIPVKPPHYYYPSLVTMVAYW